VNWQELLRVRAELGKMRREKVRLKNSNKVIIKLTISMEFNDHFLIKYSKCF